MRIIEFRAENVKRLSAVYIKPDGHVQIVGGRNAQGKTSVLDAIWFALGGGQAARGTAQPVREGEASARVELNLDGEVLVTRTWDAATGRSALRVESADGAVYRSPQAMLDNLVGRLSFDPLEFTRLSAREQVAALLDLVDLGIDLPAMADERERLYEARLGIGRDVKRIAGYVGELGEVEDAPDREESAVAVAAELRRVEGVIASHVRDREDREAANARILDLQEQLAHAQERRDALTAKIADHETIAIPPHVLEDRLDRLDALNAAVRRNVERARARQGLADAEAGYADLTGKINDLDQTKRDALAAAEFPVDGLGFDDNGVTFHGIPFGQASAAEQIRVSLAMAMALNPELRVIRILDGSLLDADNLAMIGAMAEANDFQVWIERVGDADESAVIIEDGMVKL